MSEAMTSEKTVELYRALTDRLKVLSDFVSQSRVALGGEEDPDIVTARNLAIEAALKHIRMILQ